MLVCNRLLNLRNGNHSRGRGQTADTLHCLESKEIWVYTESVSNQQLPVSAHEQPPPHVSPRCTLTGRRKH